MGDEPAGLVVVEAAGRFGFRDQREQRCVIDGGGLRGAVLADQPGDLGRERHQIHFADEHLELMGVVADHLQVEAAQLLGRERVVALAAQAEHAGGAHEQCGDGRIGGADCAVIVQEAAAAGSDQLLQADEIGHVARELRGRGSDEALAKFARGEQGGHRRRLEGSDGPELTETAAEPVLQ